MAPSDIGIRKYEATGKATNDEYIIFVIEEWRGEKLARTNEMISNDHREGLSSSLLVIDHSVLNPKLAGWSVRMPNGEMRYFEYGRFAGGSWEFGGKVKFSMLINENKSAKTIQYRLYTKLEKKSVAEQRVPELKSKPKSTPSVQQLWQHFHFINH